MAQNGFRQQAEPSRKEQVRQLATELKNTQAAARITQMMLQRLIESSQAMSYDLGKAFNMVSELQYKLLATEKVANLDPVAIAAAANNLRLGDFNEASAKEDIEKNYTVGETVKDDSIVIITTTAEDPSKSIFRSKIGLKEANVPDLTKGLLGREVGAKAVLQIAGVTHTVELLGIRQAPAPAPAEQTTVEAVPAEQALPAQVASPAAEAPATVQ